MHSRKGFTLVEILVAMLILGIVLVSSFEAINLCYQATYISRNSALLAFLAQSKLEEISYQRVIAEESSGKFSAPYENFRWQARIQKVKEVPRLISIWRRMKPASRKR